MKFPRTLFLPLLLAAIMAACANTDSDANAVELPFLVIAKGQYSAISERRFMVIEDNTQWHALWREHRGGRNDRPPLVNFDQALVLAVFMGEQRSGGYSIDIKNIKRSDNAAWVEVTEQTPPPDHMVTMALTQPFVIVQIPRIEANIRFTADNATK